MTAMTLKDILNALGISLSEPDSFPRLDLPLVDHVTADSRSVRTGSLFVAVPGVQVDGHRFIGAALAQGAAVVVGEQPEPVVRTSWEAEFAAAPEPVPYLQVARARRSLAQLAAALHRHPSEAMTVVGITGTDGKTTTCTLLESILEAHTRPPASSMYQVAGQGAGTVGVVTTVGARIRGQELDTGFHVTTPDAPDVQRFLAAMRDAGCTYAVVESTSHGLDQGRVDAVDFDVAAVTNITHEHLDYHGTRDAYVAAKALLFRALFQRPQKPDVPRFAVVNRDDPGSYGALLQAIDEERRAHAQDIPVRAYGIGAPVAPVANADADAHAHTVWASAVTTRPEGTEIEVRWWGESFVLQSAFIGEFNVYNILCATTIGLGLGIEPETIRRGIAAVQGVIGRMERIDEGQPFLALVDFAHSPASLERALLTLRPLVHTDIHTDTHTEQGGRLIAVFGSAGLRDRAKRRLMGGVSGRLADFTVVTAEDPRTESLEAINREIEAGLLEAGAAGKYRIVDDRAAAIQAAVDMARPGDVVAAFGKGHERSMCFGTVEYPWSDQDAMRAALRTRLAGQSTF